MSARDVLVYIRKVERSLNHYEDPVDVAPIMAWIDERGEKRAREELGWGGESMNRRLLHIRNGTFLFIERGLVEDALDHAGVGWWEVYDEDVDELSDEPAYCPGSSCTQMVNPLLDGTCPWCGEMTTEQPSRATQIGTS